MLSIKQLFITFSLFLFSETNAKAKNEWSSPCPGIFAYETNRTASDKWYGVITLPIDINRHSFWLGITLDRPSLQLGNWLGPVKTNNNKEYLIEEQNKEVYLRQPTIIRFYIRYNPREAPPKLIAIHLNNKKVCPEELLLQSEKEVSHPPNKIGYQQHPLCGTVIKANRSETQTNDEYSNTLVHDTEEGEFPWHAALYHSKGVDLGYICAASLISNFHVITVAHCVTKRKSQETLNRLNLVVYLGKYYLKRFSRTGIQDRQVSHILPHPQYNAQTYDNNIALVKFTTPVEFTDYVRPICLWQESADLSSVVDKFGNVAGWDLGVTTDKLLQVKMPVVSQETCIFTDPDLYTRITSSNTYCAGSRNGTSVCRGEYGGGMFFPGSNMNNPIWQLRGLVSIIVNLADPYECDMTKFVVFTDVAKHLDWIVLTMTI